jgi:hypothetical protein
MKQTALLSRNGRNFQRDRSASRGAHGEEQVLHEVRAAVARFRRISDGYLFGFFGIDALLAFIPVIGGLYSAGGGLWLLSQAVKAKASLATKTKAKVAAIVAGDVTVGAFPVLGDAADVFLRSHAWAADLILAEIDIKLGYGRKQLDRSSERHAIEALGCAHAI